MSKPDERLARLQSDQDHWKHEMGVHRRHCFRCNGAMRVGDTGKLCEYGWDVLTRQTIARNALRSYQEHAEQAAAGQLDLFDLPE